MFLNLQIERESKRRCIHEKIRCKHRKDFLEIIFQHAKLFNLYYAYVNNIIYTYVYVLKSIFLELIASLELQYLVKIIVIY